MTTHQQILLRLVTQAEEQGLGLYRLWCQHATISRRLLVNDEEAYCEVCDCESAVLHRIIPSTDPGLWPDWRTA